MVSLFKRFPTRENADYNLLVTDLNNVKVMCLYTEDFDGAYNLVCLISYFKEAIYKDLYPDITSEEIKKFLNFGKFILVFQIQYPNCYNNFF